ncbi:protein tramtrack, alpha isoform-like isoform X3 [Tenebrio molitor]|uniref:protein tramtrack, alpha isoform-like isoform X3 n=1 Tax=Tenebrio molitor TaxID=7067 RepID=UPI0036248F28
MASEQFSLCWDNFHKNMSSGMNSLLENEDLVDVTLAVEGKYLKAHKMVLSVCSPYFRELFKMNPCKHPIVFMKDVSYIAMSDLLQFMYQGEVQVSQENLTTFIKTAEALQIKGLTGDGNGSTECDNEPHDEPPKPSDVETPKVTTRPKKIHHSPAAPPAKRPRTSVTEQNVTTAVTKTEPAASSTPTNEQLIQFKMEPYDQSQSTVTIPDDNPDETFTDDPLDESNADDGNEDYSMMEGGDEEPQAGTSADGTAGEGQDPLEMPIVKIEKHSDDEDDSADNSTNSTIENKSSPQGCESVGDELFGTQLKTIRIQLKQTIEENRQLKKELMQKTLQLHYDVATGQVPAQALQGEICQVPIIGEKRVKESRRSSSEPDPNSSKGKKRAETKPNVEARYDGYAHYPGQDDKKEATRCKMEKCGGKSRTFCTKCHVHLCLQKNRNCFLQFHNK